MLTGSEGSLPGDSESPSGTVFEDLHGQRSRTFSRAVCTVIQRDEDREASEKLDGA